MCLNIDNKRPFRILSIDGGGIRGIIPAKGLALLECELTKRNKPNRICDYFDLICGTSTGAILAIGLALGISAQKMLDLYLKHAKDIFPQQNIFKQAFKILCKGKSLYDRDKLSGLIEQTYRDAVGNEVARLGHCKTRVCVPTYDVSTGKIHVFKTSHHEQFDRDYQIPAHHAALASAAAPIYYDSYDFEYELRGTGTKMTYFANVDGGIMANNPTLIGYVEAVKTLGIAPEDLQILSLGTGDSIFKDNQPNKKMGLKYWLYNKKSKIAIYDLFSSAQSEYVSNLMKFYQRGPGQGGTPKFVYERIQHFFSPTDSIKMNASDNESLLKLEHIGQHVFGDKISVLIDTFFRNLKPNFTPEHDF